MKKRIPKALSDYFSKLGKKGYRVKVKKILEKAKRQKVGLPPPVIGGAGKEKHD